MRRNKGQQDPTVANEDDGPSDFDETAFLSPLQVVRSGIAVMANEMGRLIRKSKRTGLNGMQSLVLEKYIRLASDVAKKHKDINLEFSSLEELENAPPERIGQILDQAYSNLNPHEVNVYKPKIVRKPVPIPWLNKNEN